MLMSVYMEVVLSTHLNNLKQNYLIYFTHKDEM